MVSLPPLPSPRKGGKPRPVVGVVVAAPWEMPHHTFVAVQGAAAPNPRWVLTTALSPTLARH